VTATVEAGGEQLVIGMRAELSLNDFDIDLNRVGAVHIAHGAYSIDGSTR